ncbi:MAG: hypothetical protein JST54_11815 [Deltaproteobacteria bacterium]|nr:hypothetical protein [Deltaproteobacteria bacterium]
MKKLILAAAMVLSACSTKIQHGLAERDADEIQAVLGDHGITATPVPEGKEKWALEVPQSSASEAVRILHENNLPRQQAPGFAEVFGQGSMVPTATEERAKLIQALSGENARLLQGLEGVIAAKVIVVPESKASAFGQVEPARASVLLKVAAPHADSLEKKKPEIQQLVAGSVPGLTPDHVALLVESVEVKARPTVVETKDRTAAVLVASVAGVLLALLAGGLVAAVLRARKLRLELDGDEDEDEEPTAKPAPKKAA